MANPRQRRKARSSSYKPVSQSRRARQKLKKTPPIRAPKALQDAWDKTMTVRQNYAKLGLIMSLDPATHGGVEKTDNDIMQCEPAAVPALPPTQEYGRILRDEQGQAIGFEMLTPTDAAVPETESLPEPEVDETMLHKWAGAALPDTKVVQELGKIAVNATGTTTMALPLSGAGPRHTSEGERRYLQRLVSKHGKDIDAMARDRKLNPEQRTSGQLRRALAVAGL